MKRNKENRVLTIEDDISQGRIKTYKEVLVWIKAQNKQIKLRFKLKVYAYQINLEDLTDFLNSNDIIELKFYNLNSKLSLNAANYQSIKALDMNDISCFELSKFKSL